MKRLFGTDGIRGVAGEFPLDEKTVRIIGASLARHFREKLGRGPKFVTGRDTRESGGWIEAAFHAGAKAENSLVESAEVITTPGVAFLTKHFGFDAGIVISASHNPFEDNGIKVFSPTGKKIDEELERAVEADIYARTNHDEQFSDTIADRSRMRAFRTAYIDYLIGEFNDLSLQNFKMVIDCANGASSAIAPRVFERLGAAVAAIDNSPDGRNINKDCGSLHLEKLRSKVLEENADFGVAFDGDADRALFVDEKGNIVDGDATLWIMAQYFQDHGKLTKPCIVATVMSNIGLEIALRSREIELIRTAVGDKYVLEELLKTGAAIGGEQSGHIIIPEKSLIGDGMMTTLFVAQAIFEQKKPLSEMTAGFARYPQTLVNVKVREKKPFEDVAVVTEMSKQIEDELHGEGRLLLRYSGTENLARVMIEGKDQSSIEEQANRLAEVVKASLG